MASKARINPLFWSGFSSGILKSPKTLLGVLRLLIFFKSVSEIRIIFSSEIAPEKSSVQKSVSTLKDEFMN